MPEVQREMMVSLPIAPVWDFIADMDNWAHDMPNYCGHEKQSETESLWRLKGELGPLTREMEVRVLILEWVEQTRVKFSLEGLYEPFKAAGQLGITADGPAQTRLVFDLELAAKGLMAPVLNPLLGKMAPGWCDQFIAALGADLLKGGNGSSA
ncbi:MAG: SRPBCC family protein [Actinobacteria bacterium]|nr:SRPBCC family protein [Actinomycetota bacterium]